MLGIGDIVLVSTFPPHLGSVTGGGVVICEDGTRLPLDLSSMSQVCSALQILKELERSVLAHHETR